MSTLFTDFKSLAAEARALTLSNGGASLDLDAHAPAAHVTGYFVGGIMPPIEFDETAPAEAYEHALSKIYATKPGAYAGFWNNAGTIVAEASEWFESLIEAESEGHERHEIAIYDVAAGEDIVL